ncbi:MAG: ribosomal RNA small subunit methyltransferase A [Thermoanaerobaculia bacterium]|nr:ribosomal RNA small subunit methyltransferase A [Thermoanaerobaculia bacterium]MBP9824248.1 ribosomal RNA small subunit methyltransferase A [Thermoanaerobaculia bacterium]
MKAETTFPARPRRKKALGQHHLREGSLCRPLLEFLFASTGPAALPPFVVEIGPGGGVLTAELLSAGAEVLALELDPEWAETLRSRLASEKLSVKVGDVLEFDWSAVPSGTLVCGNLPYQIGTAIVDRVLRAYPQVERAAFLLQREVVDRLTAKPGDPEYGSLSLLTQARASVIRLGIVRPGSFVPPPKVDSAFVGLRLHPAPLPESDMPEFERLLRAAFRQRRKTLLNSFTSSFSRPAVETALATVGYDPKTRAESLAMDDFLALSRALSGHAGTEAAAPGGILGAIESTGNPRKP